MQPMDTTSTSGAGITSIGSYIPRTRLSRKAIAAANSWANPGLVGRGKGHRAVCSHDEDAITMAVAAARAAQAAGCRDVVQVLQFASTTLPFADRQNAGIIREALSLPSALRTLDVTGSLRCATSALIAALESRETQLLIAADKRRTLPASTLEMSVGDAGAAVITGQHNVLAHYLGSYSSAIDMTDHYRAQHAEFDYQLEERWVRDEGLLKIIPEAISQLLETLAVAGSEISHLVLPGVDSKTGSAIATHCGIAGTAISNNLELECGTSGCAHPLLMLNHVLENAQPGDKILLIGFGQGCDALLFRATELVTRLHTEQPLQKLLNSGVEDDNYQRYLSINQLVELDWGMRAERDNRTSQSAFFRHRSTVTGFIGGRCTHCDTPQFPRRPICANPECRRSGEQHDEPFKDKRATVKSYTEDWLALCYNPPLKYGNVRFEGGGVVMMEFADFAVGEVQVGTPLRMVFRIKDEDSKRGFRRYFWKAAPCLGAS
ncbi:MAG: zinc ribbon domain-containing protein [Halieaceae bacterium]|uniref:zinc ribbon domain-containing protein n=1 Tax=Haliea alexandrii TaxID=2448162 RepID=UPI001E4948EA|nr:zinc ribbon domain-containing protein [Haliea alexandrii]MCR9184206.1 zinc ribbon domain-containing protein [Halieaceae bacterium]